MVDGILNWMTESALASFILDTSWAFPTLETLHFIGLILLIGSLYVIDLRFLGMARRVPLDTVLPFIRIALLGFVINLATGVLFLFSDPFTYYENFAFRLKILAIVLAGLNAVWFKFAAEKAGITSSEAYDPPGTLKLIAGISLVLWTVVIILGRMIPYLA